MSRVDKIEREIEELSTNEVATLRDWFIEFDARAWDRQFEADMKAGKLDALAERALDDHASGRSRKL